MKKQIITKVLSLTMAFLMAFAVVPNTVYAADADLPIPPSANYELPDAAPFEVKYAVAMSDQWSDDYISYALFSNEPIGVTYDENDVHYTFPVGTQFAAYLDVDYKYTGYLSTLTVTAYEGWDKEIHTLTGDFVGKLLYIQNMTGEWYKALVTAQGTTFDRRVTIRVAEATTTANPLAGASTWAHEGITSAINNGLVSQALQSQYTQTITRAEFCALAVTVYEKIKGEITATATFTDTNDINVRKAASVGIVNGVGDNKFDPNANLNREQAAVMLSNLAKAIGKPFAASQSTYADNSIVSAWALDGVGQVQAAGIMSGTGSNQFSPKQPYTREQSIVTILRVFEALK